MVGKILIKQYQKGERRGLWFCLSYGGGHLAVQRSKKEVAQEVQRRHPKDWFLKVVLQDNR